LALFPNFVDELREVAVRDLVPAGYGPILWRRGLSKALPDA